MTFLPSVLTDLEEALIDEVGLASQQARISVMTSKRLAQWYRRDELGELVRVFLPDEPNLGIAIVAQNQLRGLFDRRQLPMSGTLRSGDGGVEVFEDLWLIRVPTAKGNIDYCVRRPDVFHVGPIGGRG